MPNYTIAFARTTGPDARIDVKELGADALDARLHNVCTRFRGVRDRLKMLLELPGKEVSSPVWSGVPVRLTLDPKDPNKALKRKLTTKALEIFAGNAGFAIPDTVRNGANVAGGFDVYFLSATSGSAYSNMSVGFVYKDPDNMPRALRIALILGDSIASQGAQSIVADQIYDYYKPTFTVNATERRAMAAIFHEFGHVFHQLGNMQKYWALQDLQTCYAKGETGFADDDGYSTLHGNPGFGAVSAVAGGIEGYARQVSQYASSHPCEFVAETFAGTMAGIPYGADLLACYGAVGGPVPATGMAHTRSGQNWVKRNVLYPVAEKIRAIGE